MADQQQDQKQGKPVLSLRRDIDWLKVLFWLQVNLSALCAIHFLLYDSQWKTLFFSYILVLLGTVGITAGAHRLWAHQAYKATTALKIFLMLCQTLVGHGSIYDWVRWHRLHHKYFGTDLDPYNPSKGFIHAHVISLTLSLSPAQQQALEDIDMTDLEEDKVVMWQKKWYKGLFVLIVLLLPINAPVEYWGEGMAASVFIAGWLRYALTLHMGWLLHSATRVWGLKPGEKFPADTNLVFILTKSFWLSYHYLAPWDYQTGEYGKYGTDNTSTFIRVCAALELASDLKTIDSKTVRAALTKSCVEGRNITECLWEYCTENEREKLLPSEDLYLNAKKYY